MFSEQSERNVIGKCLIDERLFWETFGRLKPEHFAFARHGRIWDAMCRLADTRKPVNRSYVPLVIRGDAGEDTPISMFLAVLINDASDVQEVPIDVETVFSLASKRYLIDGLEKAKLAILGADVGVDVELMKDHAMRAIAASTSDDFDNYMKTYHQWGAELEAASFKDYESGEGGGIGFSPGLAAIERVMGRLLPGKVIVLAGMSSGGKSALARQINEAVAVQAQEKNLGYSHIASLEMSGQESAARHISEKLGIPAFKIEQGGLNPAELEALSNTVAKMKRLPIVLDSRPSMTIDDIRSRAMRTKQRRGLTMLTIDHILLMKAMQRNQSLGDRVFDSTMQAKNIAKELDVPVILLSQVDEKRVLESPSGFPNSTHLFGGQAIQQNTDLTVFIHRPEVVLSKNEPPETPRNKPKEGEDTPHQKWVKRMDKERGRAYVYNQKRRGGQGNVKEELRFDGPTMSFADKDV